MTVCKSSSPARNNPCQGSTSRVVQMHSQRRSAFNASPAPALQVDARKAAVVDGSEKIPLMAVMAVCICVVRMWSLQMKANAATHETSSMAG